MKYLLSILSFLVFSLPLYSQGVPDDFFVEYTAPQKMLFGTRYEDLRAVFTKYRSYIEYGYKYGNEKKYIEISNDEIGYIYDLLLKNNFLETKYKELVNIIICGDGPTEIMARYNGKANYVISGDGTYVDNDEYPGYNSIVGRMYEFLIEKAVIFDKDMKIIIDKSVLDTRYFNSLRFNFYGFSNNNEDNSQYVVKVNKGINKGMGEFLVLDWKADPMEQLKYENRFYFDITDETDSITFFIESDSLKFKIN